MFLYLVMNKSAILLVIGVAAVLAVVLAPTLGSTASARKTETCTVGGSDTLCANTGVDRDDSPAARKTCTNPSGNNPGSCSGNIDER